MKKESKKSLLKIVWSIALLGMVPIAYGLWNLYHCEFFGCIVWAFTPLLLISAAAVLLVIAVMVTVFVFYSKGIRTQEKI